MPPIQLPSRGRGNYRQKCHYAELCDRGRKSLVTTVLHHAGDRSQMRSMEAMSNYGKEEERRPRESPGATVPPAGPDAKERPLRRKARPRCAPRRTLPKGIRSERELRGVPALASRVSTLEPTWQRGPLPWDIRGYNTSGISRVSTLDIVQRPLASRPVVKGTTGPSTPNPKHIPRYSSLRI